MSERRTSPSQADLESVDGRSRNRLRRRERVYTAAVELFVERGFDRTRMDDIAERANVARATVFNHFQRKSSFVDEWSARRRERARSAVDAIASEEPLDVVLTAYLSALAKENRSSRKETVAFFGPNTPRSTDAVGDTYLARDLARAVEKAASRGEIRADVDPDTVGLLLTSAYFGAIERWIADPPPFDLGKKLLAMLNMVVAGITA